MVRDTTLQAVLGGVAMLDLFIASAPMVRKLAFEELFKPVLARHGVLGNETLVQELSVFFGVATFSFAVLRFMAALNFENQIAVNFGTATFLLEAFLLTVGIAMGILSLTGCVGAIAFSVAFVYVSINRDRTMMINNKDSFTREKRE